MRILIVQHEKGSPPGATLDWLKSRNINSVTLRLDQGEKLPPSADSFDGIVFLGGEMNVDQEDKFPWLKEEKAFIRACIANGKTKILGICLGGQLVAEVLGAKVYKNSFWEIGWSQVEILHGSGIPAEGSSILVPQWHGYVFDLPQNASLLMKGRYWPNQAFQVGGNVIGVQFHPEATAEFVTECAVAQRTATQITATEQSESEIMEKLGEIKVLHNWYFKLLDAHFLERAK